MRHAALWAVLLLVAGACGGEDDRRRAGSGDLPLGGGMSLRFSIDPDPPRAGRPVTWSLTVRNEGVEAVTLTFSSGKSGDVILRPGSSGTPRAPGSSGTPRAPGGKTGSTEAYRWSRGRFFTEAVRREVVRPNRDKVYRLDEPKLPVEPGRYELVASLAAEPAPEPVRRTINVAPG